MGQGLYFKEMLSMVRIALECIPEHRKGQNTQYTLKWTPLTRPRSGNNKVINGGEKVVERVGMREY